MATYKNDIILIAGSGDFAFEAANFLIAKGKLNHIVLISKNTKIIKRYKNISSYFDIRNIDTEEKGMAPHELWCNESQERYVLAIDQQSLNLFKKICERERCPFRVIGKAKKNRHLHVKDNLLNQDVVNMELDVLLGKPPKLLKKILMLPFPLLLYVIFDLKPIV